MIRPSGAAVSVAVRAGAADVASRPLSAVVADAAGGVCSLPLPEHPETSAVVIAMNPDTKSATVVSLPRDTKLELDGYKTNKLNAYYPNFLAAEKKSGMISRQRRLCSWS